VEGADVIEGAMAGIFKDRGFRKRGRNWFRTTRADQYQVVNLQRSSWGGGDCYLNLGWDPVVPEKGFRPENQCCFHVRAEQTGVIPPLVMQRPDGVTTIDVPGVSLLDSEMYRTMTADALSKSVAGVIAEPVADFMDATPAIVDLVPLLTAKPWFASLAVREHLQRQGHELPTSW